MADLKIILAQLNETDIDVTGESSNVFHSFLVKQSGLSEKAADKVFKYFIKYKNSDLDDLTRLIYKETGGSTKFVFNQNIFDLTLLELEQKFGLFKFFVGLIMGKEYTKARMKNLLMLNQDAVWSREIFRSNNFFNMFVSPIFSDIRRGMIELHKDNTSKFSLWGFLCGAMYIHIQWSFKYLPKNQVEKFRGYHTDLVKESVDLFGIETVVPMSSSEPLKI